jgi:chromosome segregation ATPase
MRKFLVGPRSKKPVFIDFVFQIPETTPKCRQSKSYACASMKPRTPCPLLKSAKIAFWARSDSFFHIPFSYLKLWISQTVDLQSEIRAKTLIADELKADMKRADTKYAELKTSNDRVALELEAEKASAAAMRLELRLSESRLNDAQREAREARSQLDEVRSSADGATKATAEAVAQASQREQELQARIQALETEAVELRAQAESLTAEKQLFEQQYAQFQDEFEKHHEEHQTLLVAHRALGKEKEALEAELEQWPAKVEAAKVSAQDETKRVMELAEQERQQAIVREAQHQQQVQVEMVRFYVLGLDVSSSVVLTDQHP